MKKKEISLKFSAMALAVLLAGCGGGGSDGYYNQGGSTNTNSGNENNSGEGQTENKQPVNISDISLLDVNNTVIDVVTSEGAMALVQVTNEKNEPIASTIVRFQGDGILLGTSNGAVLTDNQGYARIAISPQSNITGAYQLTASTEYKQNSATSNVLYFTIAERQTTIKNIRVSANPIKAGDSVQVTLDTVDPVNSNAQNNVEINFSAKCGTFKDPIVNSVNGKVSATYHSVTSGGLLCADNDIITASTKDGKSTSTIPITISATPPNSIIYSSNETLLYTSTSGQTSTGYVEFTVQLDGKVVANQPVNVEILRGPTDLSFVSRGNRDSIPVISNNDGIVRVNLYPGAIPGPVEIKASLASDNKIFAVSRGVSIGTGRVTQTGLSLSVSKNALQGKMDGDAAVITARMVDRVGNPVPDNTVITFVTEGGSIDTRCLTKDGQCSVNLRTQDPRPKDNRVSVLAYVEGEKSFIDVNGTNIWNNSVDTLLHNIGSFYRDDNENGVYDNDIGEFLYKGHNGTAECATHTSADGQFPVLRFPNIAATCTNQLDAVIREQLIFSFSQDNAVIRSPKATMESGELTFQLFGNTAYSVPMPSGTKVQVEVEDNTDNDKSCSATLWFGNETVPTVFNMLTPTTFVASSQVYYSYRLKDCAVNDKFLIKVAAPNNQVSNKEVILIEK